MSNALQQALQDALKKTAVTIAKATPPGMAYSALSGTPFKKNLDEQFDTFTQKILPQAQKQLQPTFNKVSTVVKQTPKPQNPIIFKYIINIKK